MRRGMPMVLGLVKPLLIYYIGYYAVRMTVGALFSGSGTSFLAGGGSAVVNGIAMLGGCIALFPMINDELEEERRDRNRRAMRDALEDVRPRRANGVVLFLRYLMLAVFAVASCVFFNALISLSGLAEGSAAFQETALRQYSVPLGMGLFLYAVVAAAAEEMVFRFLIYNRLRRLDGRVPYAVFGSAFLFALYHGNVVQALYAFVLGLLIAYAYSYFGSFAAPVLFHGIGNAAIFLGGMIPEINRILFSPAMLSVFGLITAAGCLFPVYRQRLNRAIPKS